MAPIVSVAKEAGGIAVLSIALEPVNMMAMEMWQELLATMEALEADKEVRGVVFRSGLKKSVFTAGLDIKELYAPATNEKRLLEYWHAISNVLIKIYSTPLVTVAAIRGACPAGGCCLALCCDYRVITPDGSMGLNEVQLGIPVPDYWVELMSSVIGQRATELMLSVGEQPGVEKLMRLGMVDAIAEDEKLLPQALEVMRAWLKNPDLGRVVTKEALRSGLAERWSKGASREAAKVWNSVSDERTVASLQQVLARLSGGKKEKPAAKL